MTLPKMTAADREREARETAMRRRRTSIRVGSAGVLLLFLGGAGIVLSPAYVAVLLVGMIVGIGLVVVAFLLAWNLARDLTKIT